MAEHPAASTAPAKAGELVLLDYDIWAETGGKWELIDTTRAATAEAEHFDAPAGAEYGPRPHLLGGDDFPAALESMIATAPVGKEIEREFAPADAFGERDPKLIELFSMHEIERLPEMRREDAELGIGTILTIHGRRGRVTSYTAARVRVDFNPPFAGRKVKAKVQVTEAVHEPVAKARALVELTYGRSKDFQFHFHDKVLTLTLPDRTKFDLAWHSAAKARLVERLRAQLAPTAIRFVEEYVTPAPPKAAEPKASKPATPAADAKEAPDADDGSKPAGGAEKPAAKHAPAKRTEHAAPKSE
jgi:FKBP-type peptidyl-prolyl cis-trans isomerase SlyD